ncbi:hypothetical protein ACWGH7_31255 [Streptomyces cyaneofuscatus]
MRAATVQGGNHGYITRHRFRDARVEAVLLASVELVAQGGAFVVEAEQAAILQEGTTWSTKASTQS